MKHLKTFESYKYEMLNEGIFDFLKKLFGQLFSNIEAIYTEQTQRVFKDIENQKNPKEVYDILKKFLVITKNTFTKDMENATNILKLRDAAYSNFISLYSAFTTASKKLGNNNISFENVFGDNPPKDFKKIFAQKDEKKRTELFKGYTDTLIENLGTGIKIEDFSILKNPIGYKETKKDTTATNTEQQGEIANPTDNQNNQQNKTKITKEQITNLKDILVQWFDSNIYKKINANIGDIANNADKGGDDLDNMIKNITSTNNKEGLKKMLTKIANLNDPKKYAEVRDKLAELGIVDANDINKF